MQVKRLGLGLGLRLDEQLNFNLTPILTLNLTLILTVTLVLTLTLTLTTIQAKRTSVLSTYEPEKSLNRPSSLLESGNGGQKWPPLGPRPKSAGLTSSYRKPTLSAPVSRPVSPSSSTTPHLLNKQSATGSFRVRVRVRVESDPLKYIIEWMKKTFFS
jgi:hypothetical protein